MLDLRHALDGRTPLQEGDPRVRLHWPVDTAVLVVRWTVAPDLLEPMYARGGT